MNFRPGERSGASKAGESESPAYLGRFVTVFSLASFVMISLLMGVSLYFIYRHHIIGDAEENAVNIGYAIYEREKSLLVKEERDGDRVLAVTPENIPRLDQRIKLYLQPLSIVKIIFFDRRGKIIYSTDGTAASSRNHKGTHVERALQGEISSTIVKKGLFTDLAGETRIDADVVETYVPVLDNEHRVIGVFELYSDVSRAYAEVKVVSLRSLAVLVAVLAAVFGILQTVVRKLTRRLLAVQNELEKIAITDDLTGLYNRGYLIGRGQEEIIKMRRLGARSEAVSETGFVLFDIDNFKDINDRFGHIAGDQVLQEIAVRVKHCVRAYDIVGRFGGEEFLVILPNTPLEETTTIAARIWKRFRETPFTFAGRQHQVTSSFGVASFAGEENSIQDILQKADERLYAAKREGKDRIVAV